MLELVLTLQIQWDFIQRTQHQNGLLLPDNQIKELCKRIDSLLRKR